jgi:Cu(I)/Ag(I) efflux system membrane fusion protein
MHMKSMFLVLAVALAGCGQQSKPASKPGTYGQAALTEPVKAVYANYFTIQAALAEDSLKGVPEAAAAMAVAAGEDKAGLLPAEVGREAGELAKAKDIAAAREVFKSLSDGLIKYLAEHEVKSGGYQEFYCPMQEAYWLQKDKDTANPYFGASMPACGTPKRTF